MENQKTDIQSLRSLAINWQLRGDFGWGIYGTHLVLQMLLDGSFRPVLLMKPNLESVSPLYRSLLSPSAAEHRRLQDLWDADPNQSVLCDAVLTGFGDDFCTRDFRVRGRKNVGMIFFNNTNFSATSLAKAAQQDLIIAGSTWNEQILRARGVRHVETVIQGIDPTVFHPAERSGLFRNKFVIFSGGKLSYQKGQDIVVAAFRAFQQRHPEAVLITAWYNHWPESVSDIGRAGHVKGPPASAQDSLSVGQWLIDNGVPMGTFISLHAMPNYTMGPILREADVALFPNRSEGGTNLVAMEAMACGVPTILSANTGHLDLVRPGVCYPLANQRPIPHATPDAGMEGWGESDVDEVVERLEHVYQRREESRTTGQAAAAWLRTLTWENQIRILLDRFKQLDTLVTAK